MPKSSTLRLSAGASWGWLRAPALRSGFPRHSLARLGKEPELADHQTGHNCAGLYSDSIAHLMGLRPEVQLIPFRGEYYSLVPDCRLVRALVCPVPNPEFPFLGVHFTKRIDGGHEGYKFWDVSLQDLRAMLGFKGFRAMARRYWRTEVYELYRSLSRRAFLRAL